MDEAKNRADVEVYLRSMAAAHVKGEVRMEDIEADVMRLFGVDMKGEMADLQKPMDASREIYRKVVTVLAAQDGFAELLEFSELRPDPTQESDDFETVHAQAIEAQDILMKAFATDWELDPGPKHPDTGKPFVYHSVKGSTTRDWIEMVDSPGVKGKTRAKEKVDNDVRRFSY